MLKISLFLTFSYIIFVSILGTVLPDGFWGYWLESSTALKIILMAIFVAHITIVAMSLSFHRYHTHKGLVISKLIDYPMQIWLWLITGMSKLDWVSVHIYHHAFSDTAKDPHSPVQKGFWRVFFLGVKDYTEAKHWPEIRKIRNTLSCDKLEAFIDRYALLGPIIMTVAVLLAFGPFYGSLIALLNFAVSPLFAVGGVNGLAHWWGYQTYASKDNSRNIGFLFPLNFIISGELDHNNHHAHPRSCSFRHKWYEFDIGFFYIWILNKLGLAEIVHKFESSKVDRTLMVAQIKHLIEKDYRFKNKIEELANEFNCSKTEILGRIEKAFVDRKIRLERPLRDLIAEMERTIKVNRRLSLNY